MSDDHPSQGSEPLPPSTADRTVRPDGALSESLPAVAASVRLAPTPQPPRSRRAAPLPPEVGHRHLPAGRSATVSGTVTVAGLWDLRDGPRADRTDGLFALAELSADERPSPTGVPLWRRLAWLLQPPAELLLAAEGPLTWPSPLFPYQIEGVQTLLTEPALLLADDMGLGKAQPLDAKVLTPQGWKRMGEIEAGDPVINSQGGVSTVLGVYPQGEKDIYRVVFSDGSATECSDEHLWHVTSAVRRHRRQPGQVLPLHTIRARLFDGAGNARHYIPMVRPIEFPEGCLPIHPYLLGVLLGDGGFRHRAIFTSADEELVERLKSLLPDGVDMRPIGRFDFRISRKPSLYRNPVITALRDLGLFGHGSSTKFIPADYKFASVASRTALLQGLLDTDGCVRPTDNNIEYTTASRQLADDVAFIVQSLGGRATVRLKSPRYRHNGELRHGKTAYRMSVILPHGIEPFALSRKADIYNPRLKYQPSRAMRDVVYVGRERAQCIRVDAPDGLYITDDCIVTHNTVQAIAAMRILMLQRRIGAALIVVPAGLVTQWRAQLERWAPELRVATIRGPFRERAWQWQTPAHVCLTSYETLRADFAAHGTASPARRWWDLAVLDEAQKIKNRDADLSWLCKLLPRRRAWALTGTPLENSVDDLASILEFVTPLAPGETPPVWGEGPALSARQHAVQLRRRKADVLPELPPKTVIQVRLRLEGGQRQTYDRAEQEGVLALRQLGAGLRIEHVLELLVRLKQICNVCPRTGESAKLNDLAERLQTLREEGHRALVFSQFTDDTFGVRAIARRLARFAPLTYTGDMGAAARDRVIETFKQDATRGALLLSLRAGGQGLNLTEASYVVHFDRWWNPAVERQAEDRSHRLGQTVPVTVYTYVCEETIEQRIDDILRAKQALFEDLVDEISLDPAAGLSGAEVFSIFGLRPT